MARNSTGVYSRVTPPGAGGYIAGNDILPAEVNAEIVDLGAEISNSIDKSGRTTITANIPMNSKKLTGLAQGSASGDSVEFGQLPKFPIITATVAANALTLGMSAQYTEFRNSSLASGAVSVINAPATSLVVPNGATLGTTSGVNARLILLLINNAGTVELAVSNLAGAVTLTEAGLISTVAIDAASDSANVIYSGAARTNVPFRVVGVVTIQEAIAGVWADAPSNIQGTHGQAWSAFHSLGFGQTWQDMVVSRSLNTNFTNNFSRPIQVNATFTSTLAAKARITITQNSVAVVVEGSGGAAGTALHISAIIPVGAVYNVSESAGTPTLVSWAEMS